jgi:hypothetical protein
MDDPFGLSSIQKSVAQVPTPPQEVQNQLLTKKPRKVFMWLSGVALVLVLSVAAYLVFAKEISADVSSGSAEIEISGLPEEVSPGEQFIITAQISPTESFSNASLIVYAGGLTFDLASLDGAKSLSSDALGNLSKSATAGFDYKLNLDGGQKRQVQFKTSVNTAITEADLFVRLEGKQDPQSCGPLGVLQCAPENQVLLASSSVSVKVTLTTEISIKKGWSIFSIPYLMEKNVLKDLLLGLKNRKVYAFDPQTGAYIDLAGNLASGKEDVLDHVAPGKGMLVFSSDGEKMTLPTNKTAINPSEDFKYSLKIGYNFLANPFSAVRIIFTQNVLVQKLSDDGTPTGQAMTYKEAIDTGILAVPVVLNQKTFTGSNNETTPITDSAEYKSISYGAKILPFSGFVVEARQLVQIILSPDNLARADLLSEARLEQIRQCLSARGLDEYGNKEGTVYPEGAPLDNYGEKYTNPLDSVIDKNLDKSC